MGNFQREFYNEVDGDIIYSGKDTIIIAYALGYIFTTEEKPLIDNVLFFYTATDSGIRIIQNRIYTSEILKNFDDDYYNSEYYLTDPQIEVIGNDIIVIAGLINTKINDNIKESYVYVCSSKYRKNLSDRSFNCEIIPSDDSLCFFDRPIMIKHSNYVILKVAELDRRNKSFCRNRMIKLKIRDISTTTTTKFSTSIKLVSYKNDVEDYIYIKDGKGNMILGNIFKIENSNDAYISVISYMNKNNFKALLLRCEIKELKEELIFVCGSVIDSFITHSATCDIEGEANKTLDRKLVGFVDLFFTKYDSSRLILNIVNKEDKICKAKILGNKYSCELTIKSPTYPILIDQYSILNIELNTYLDTSKNYRKFSILVNNKKCKKCHNMCRNKNFYVNINNKTEGIDYISKVNDFVITPGYKGPCIFNCKNCINSINNMDICAPNININKNKY